MTLLTETIEDTPDGYEGQLWMTWPHAVDTVLAEETIPPGRLVSSHSATGDNGVLLPASADDVTNGCKQGIAMFRVAKSEVSSNYVVAEPLSRITQGRVWVLAENVVTDGGSVYVRFQNGDLGRFRSDTAAGDAALLAGACFRGSTSGADELVVVEINRP